MVRADTTPHLKLDVAGSERDVWIWFSCQRFGRHFYLLSQVLHT